MRTHNKIKNLPIVDDREIMVRNAVQTMSGIVNWYSDPVFTALFVYEILIEAGFDITIEDISGCGMSSWPEKIKLIEGRKSNV